ncbi:TetR/AcrR family transcriptional regulator [Aldersonia sp. NBC_00410]|uniref:TetR/AcrR family transcriptional regulator n=1 Tax=Aldersonia sp. NBC_00410 TaxID=2975954 RepID=UPI00224E27FC|nr:TetR/AcrR family transcriptional regulator [Aldersonia sp. NBC_00410]MCX5044430.1 TetR/AcrR family transcriptional regulator [Aldersonia sp. NBC_00410]
MADERSSRKVRQHDFDDLDERIMDATLARITQVGIRRSSLEDIARRVGINRITIHRRFDGKDNLIEAVLEREARRMLTEVTAIATTVRGVDAQIEETVLHVLLNTRMHRLATQQADVAPDEALAFYTVQGERLISVGVDYIAGMLRHAQANGLIDAYDAGPVAEIVARLAHSLMLTPGGGAVDFADIDSARAFVRATIVPLMKHGISTRAEEKVAEPARDSAQRASACTP